MPEQDFVGEIMGFDPSNLDVFQEKENKNYDQNVYKTNPVTNKVVSEDGHYRSLVKIIYNPYNPKRSIVNQIQYVLRDQTGMFFVNSSLADGDKNCPIFKGWKKLWFSGDDAKKEFAKKMFERNESMWVLVQIMEDNNHPELVGQFKLMKLPRTVYNKLDAKMHPSADSKKTPVALMDYLIGPCLEIDVTPGPDDPKQPSRKQREISYDLCDFATDYTPVTQVNGQPLFTEAELETIDAYATAKENFAKAKTDAKRQAAQEEIAELADSIRGLYGKALEYLKTYAIDPVSDKGFQPWTPEVAARVDKWIGLVVNMQDPANADSAVATIESPEQAAAAAPKEAPKPAAPKSDVESFIEGDLPF